MGIFNQNGGFVKFMNKALDILLVNILWVIFSLPIVTIGASTCAAFYVTLKMVDEEEGYIAKTFVKGFKDNFKQGTIMWLVTAPVLYILYLFWQMVTKADDVNIIAFLGVIFVTILVMSALVYTFPMIARYKNDLRIIVRNSSMLCIQYYKKSMILLLVVALEVAIICWNRWTLLAGLLFGAEFIFYTISGVAKKIFLEVEKTEPIEEDSDAEEDEGDDEEECNDEENDVDDEADEEDDVENDDGSEVEEGETEE